MELQAAFYDVFGVEDTQPKSYSLTGREFVSFNKFKGFESSVKKFKKTVKNLNDSDNSFFDAIIYGIMSRGKNTWKMQDGRCLWA